MAADEKEGALCPGFEEGPYTIPLSVENVNSIASIEDFKFVVSCHKTHSWLPKSKDIC